MNIFCDALASIGRTAVYTAGDLRTVLSHCSDNPFISGIAADPDLIKAWSDTADRFFTHDTDKKLAKGFITEYGKGDLAELVSYIEHFKRAADEQCDEAVSALRSKGKLYMALGIFCSTVAVLIFL